MCDKYEHFESSFIVFKSCAAGCFSHGYDWCRLGGERTQIVSLHDSEDRVSVKNSKPMPYRCSGWNPRG